MNLITIVIIATFCERVVELLKEIAPGMPNWVKILLSMVVGILICVIWQVSLAELVVGFNPGLADYLLTGAIIGSLGGAVHEVLKLLQGLSGK